jgi:hypothetical protein
MIVLAELAENNTFFETAESKFYGGGGGWRTPNISCGQFCQSKSLEIACQRQAKHSVVQILTKHPHLC